MSRSTRLAALLLAAALADPAGAEVVLLTNGAVFEGAVERSPDGILVQGVGSLVRFRTAEVEHIAPSLEGAYDWKRAALGDQRTADDHLRLADWALEHRLWPQAARELLDARQLDPHSRRLGLLERRLDELAMPPSATANRPQRRSDPPPEPAAPRETIRVALPPDGVEQFTRRVQPMLLNGCAAVGCHGGEPVGGFALDLAPRRGYGDARSTERNLAAVVALVLADERPGESLLRAAVGPHAGAVPFQGPRRAELLARLESWVAGVALANRPPEPASPNAAAAPAAEDRPAHAAQQFPKEEIAAGGTPPIPPANHRRGVDRERYEPRDEFDPEVFNTRHRRPEDDGAGNG